MSVLIQLLVPLEHPFTVKVARQFYMKM